MPQAEIEIIYPRTSAGINLADFLKPTCTPDDASKVLVGPGVSKIVATKPIKSHEIEVVPHV